MDEQVRQTLLSRPRLIGAAVGAGMSAAAAEKGGADLLLVLSAGYFRQQGVSSMAALLPYADANQLTWDLAVDCVKPRTYRVPIILGVCAQDPGVSMAQHLKRALDHGIAGVTNFPSVGFIDGTYRAGLEEAELGFHREVEMLKQAQGMGLFTVGFCFTPAEAAMMAEARVDVLCFNLGFAEWRPKDPQAHEAALDRAVNEINAAQAAVGKTDAGATPMVIFGGPVVLPRDMAVIYQRTGARGYIGGSTIERYPATQMITQVVREFCMIAQESGPADRLGAMIGCSAAMQEVFETIRKVAQADVTVLLTGESGTGKELAAREIHRLSLRNPQPFVCWNCGAITESLAMAELFGHEKGAFTGAVGVRLGKFEQAHRATLFMDEIADLPLAVQASLLRTLQERQVVRVGGEATIPVDVRLIAATNKDFTELIPSKQFRLDLYYRLNTVVIRLPALRERREDIPVLVRELMQEFSRVYHCPAPRVPERVMQTLMEYNWPGNIRELRSAIERTFVMERGEPLSVGLFEDLFAMQASLETGGCGVKGTTETRVSKRSRAAAVLAAQGGNKAAAARTLGVTRRTLYAWLAGQSPV